jgi:hypothetical protein
VMVVMVVEVVAEVVVVGLTNEGS